MNIYYYLWFNWQHDGEYSRDVRTARKHHYRYLRYLSREKGKQTPLIAHIVAHNYFGLLTTIVPVTELLRGK